MRKCSLALKGMVDNYRSDLKDKDVDTSKYTDEELYRVIDYWAGMSTSDEQFFAVMDDVLSDIKR